MEDIEVFRFHNGGIVDARESLTMTDVEEKLTCIVADSFLSRPMPKGNITRRECTRRTDKAIEIFCALHEDCGWSTQRSLDHLPAFLARFLDGQEPIPEWAKRKVGDSESAMWGAEAAGRVEPERRLSALAKGGVQQPLIIVPGRYRNG